MQSGAMSASENMALDEQIYKRYLEDGVGVLRLYRWRAPAFTYGFSQTPHEQMDLEACVADGIEVVKRITGGGILFHDDEITYSFVCSKADLNESAAVFVDYRNICKFLLRFYTQLGLESKFALDSENFKQRSAPHELCSGAHEKHDIVIGKKKIGGNAQKRNRQAVFQHGSIPCRINWDLMRKYVKVLPKDISAHVTTLGQELGAGLSKVALEERLIDAFAQTFKVKFSND